MPTHALRQKRFTSRSRTGCVKCRQRRVRCDEEQPACTNCKRRREECLYDNARLPRREAGAPRHPGEQAPWAIQYQQSRGPLSRQTMPGLFRYKQSQRTASWTSWQVVPGDALDPFDALPIDMPLKSKELLHSFFRVGGVANLMPTHPTGEGIAAAIHDKCGLRNILLIASFQYAWKFGGLGLFKQTFLFHKGQTLRLVNEQLRPSHFLTVCADHILTLCFAECCFGNFAVAEAHLEGLMLYMEVRDSIEPKTAAQAMEKELSDRYFVLAYNMVQGLKSRLNDFLASPAGSQYSSKPQPDAEELERLVPEWHSYEADGIGVCFDAMGMFPSFFSASLSQRTLYPIDAEPILHALREITGLFNLRYSKETMDEEGKPLYQLWDQGGPSRLFFTVVNAHIDSFSDEPPQWDKKPSRLESSWIGMAVVVGMYLCSILGIWNQGQPGQGRLLRYMISAIRRDLMSTPLETISQNKEARDFWFWKAYIVAFTLTHARMEGGPDPKVDNLAVDIAGCIRAWAKLTGTSSWKHAREALSSVVWPANSEREELAERIWNQLVLRSHAHI